jgi:hypothetical protein
MVMNKELLIRCDCLPTLINVFRPSTPTTSSINANSMFDSADASCPLMLARIAYRKQHKEAGNTFSLSTSYSEPPSCLTGHWKRSFESIFQSWRYWRLLLPLKTY